jgi:hypothetical protein
MERIYVKPFRRERWKCGCTIPTRFLLHRDRFAVDQGRGTGRMVKISAYDILRFTLLFGVSAAYFLFFG